MVKKVVKISCDTFNLSQSDYDRHWDQFITNLTPLFQYMDRGPRVQIVNDQRYCFHYFYYAEMAMTMDPLMNTHALPLRHHSGCWLQRANNAIRDIATAYRNTLTALALRSAQ